LADFDLSNQDPNELLAEKRAFVERLERQRTERAYQSIYTQIIEIGRQERETARLKAELTDIKPVRTGFKPHPDPKIDAALDQIWQSGPNGRALYVKIAKGLTLLTERDVCALAGYLPKTLEKRCAELLADETD
jgi:hypothetical protein